MTPDKLKTTVRLPKTDFSMKANLSNLEPKLIDIWKSTDIYKSVCDKNKGRNKFILHDGPPYANGNLHIGHALNKILKDIVVRSYINMGYDSPLVIGWDCHGLPIEWKIEEKYKAKNISKADIDIVKLRKDCRDFAGKWIDIQKEEFRRLGVFADYDNPYITMDYKAESIIVRSIFKLLKDHAIYQGKKPVFWSVVEQTALAEAEVDYKEKTSDSLYVGFEIDQIGNKVSDKSLWENAFIAIWTTTPWTLPVNQALAYGEEISYGLYEVESISKECLIKVGTKLVIAEDLSQICMDNFGVTKFKKIDKIQGLEGFTAKHCMYEIGYNFSVPALKADYVELTAGTGIVHTAPCHGEDDFYLCMKHNVKPRELVLEDGTYNEDAVGFVGDHIFKVAPKIIEKLTENNKLLFATKIVHSYPHSWRSKAPLIFKLTSQWFISLEHENMREIAVKSLDNIEFYPAKGKNRLKSMLENRPDWCISRQRFWGVPMSIFIHKKTKEPIVDEKLFNNIIEAFEKEGAEAWYNRDPLTFLPEQYNKEDYIPVSDIVDVWLESGLTNEFVLKEQDHLSFPADLYLEGSDQHRGWFQSSLIMSLLLNKVSPYKKVLTHGYVLNDKNEKMSKSASSGNLDPNSVSAEFGADVLRLWVTSSDCYGDVNIGKGILIQQTETYRKIRNVLRYLLANLTYFETAQPYEKLDILDQWVLNNIYLLDKEFENTFKNTFNIHGFFNKLLQFIQTDLSSFYFDIRKDVLYCDADTNDKFLSTLTVLNITLEYLLKWLSPTIPFTAEEVFAKRYNKDLGTLSLHDFEKANSDWQSEKVIEKVTLLQKIRKIVNRSLEKAREEKIIGSSLEAQPIIYLAKNHIKNLENIFLEEICIVSSVEIRDISQLDKNKEYFTSDEEDQIAVQFSKAKGSKCERCWKITEEIQVYKEVSLCKRCKDYMVSNT